MYCNRYISVDLNAIKISLLAQWLNACSRLAFSGIIRLRSPLAKLAHFYAGIKLIPCLTDQG